MDSSAATEAFSALSQPTRLEVFRLLIRSGADGMLAGDIARALASRQNTMSANLSILAQSGLVRAEREGRAIRYRADLGGVEALLRYLLRNCCGGRPAECEPMIATLVSPLRKGVLMPSDPYNVLFLCTGNSARSIMAEAIMNRAAPDRFRAFSAGSHPKGTVNSHATALLQKLNYDVSGVRSKDWSEFAEPGGPKMDFVFTVCDQAAAESCPVWPGQPMSAHWGMPDPARAEGSPAEIALAFADTFRMLERRINVFAALPLASLDKLSLQERLTDIGRSR